MKPGLDFKRAPLLLIWEVTRACALACRHCRAAAEDWRHPKELTTEQGFRLIDDVAEMGTPLIIFTGGDPLQRDDLEELVRRGVSRGLRVGTIPAATPRLTRERLVSLRDAGVHQLALSFDGPDEATHDAFRRVEGTFARAMQGAAWAREVGLPLQVNTVFGSWNVQDFDAMAELVTKLGVVFWEVFFLVPTGRGTELQGCTAEQFELLFEKLHRLSLTAPFVIKVTEGQHFRRYVAQRQGGRLTPPPHAGGHPGGHPGGPSGARPGVMMSASPVNAAHGFCFVDHIGQAYPSGFLPIPCGDVRETSVIKIYREHPTFVALRDYSKLKGKCGRCEFRDLCSGGSRARAYALTGDFMAEEASCAYEPAGVPAPSS